ncbi:MAG: FHA domain-containing protein [Cyanophyceae cyanobacterium]
MNNLDKMMMNLDRELQNFKATLEVEGQSFQRTVTLQDNTYIIGRHSSSSIVLPSGHISRCHATLVRKYDKLSGYHFCVVDGDLQGNRSRNGLLVNHKKCFLHQLKHGDIINFGYGFKARYQVEESSQPAPAIIKPPATPAAEPLGAVLRKADLITPVQLEIALQDQEQYNELRLGEILALRGWIKQETADFFASQWHQVLHQEKRPLGHYLKQAALLNDAQIEAILTEQKRSGVRFGSLAYLQGWLKQATVDYIANSLAPSARNYPVGKTLERILKTRQITLEQQNSLSALMLDSSLSAAEQTQVQEIQFLLYSGQLKVVKH